MKGKQNKQWSETLGVQRNAQICLPRMAQAWIEEGTELAVAAASPAAMHRFRLRTKALRYTLELFRPCYGPGFEAKLGALQGIQQLLGDVNDAVSAARMLPRTARARAVIERRAEAKALEFRKDWTAVFDAPGQERLWIRYLSRPVER